MEKIRKLLVVVTLLVLSFNAFKCFGCHEDELDALLQLKSAINYPSGNSIALTDWKKEEMGRPSECCDWEVVYCGKSGRVVSLYLGEVRQAEIQGVWYVNASLFLPFRHLQELELYGNSIIGWTQHLRQLSSLRELDLSNNSLKGMIDVYDIEALQKLERLDLGGNSIDGFKRFHGGDPGSTSTLERLYLYGITFHDANTFLDSLTSLFPSLKSLYLGGNDFMGAVETSGWLCQLKKIEELVISDNYLKGQFPLCLRNLTSLQHLDLSHNNLDGKLPLFLANLTSLQYLDLSSNQFVGNVAKSPLTKLTSLQALSLANNKFQIPQTFKSFANHSSLKVLWLDGNNVIPDNATHQLFVPKFQLSYLSLSNCNIVAPLPNFMLSQYNLTYLDLSHNYIGGSFPDWIVENNTFLLKLTLANNSLIGSLHLSRHPHSQMEELDVSCNNINYLSANLSQSIPNILFINLSRNSIKVITPSNFGDMKHLSCLDLSYNHLTGEMPKNCIKGCLSLEALLLSHNNLGVIPPLSNSTSLRILRLNNNNLSGMFPSSLFPTSLLLMDLSNNHLVGQIPVEMCKLNLLNFLDLSNNNLFGFLPSCFSSTNLVYVYLNKNKLNGSLLQIFKNNTSLVTLDLGDNHLSGVIPEWIGDLHSLSILTLSNNHFEGHIPTQVCSLNQLTILDLSSNNISGQIPHCLNQMTFQPHEEKSIFNENDTFIPFPTFNMDLEFAFYEYTQSDTTFFKLFCTIQNVLEITTKSHTYTYVGKDLDSMSTIDLSCNKLSGEIPPEIGSMIGVRALNLSHNKLIGSIPSILSKLTQIESLDLSYNKLNGSIPSELIKLNALEVFSVAHNNLSGRTPEQKAQFGTFGESSYQGNPFLCGPPLLNDCSTSTPSCPEDHNVNDVDGSIDMDIFYVSFTVSSLIMFVGTLIVLYVNPHWRGMWFYYGEMWIISIYYFTVDRMGKA